MCKSMISILEIWNNTGKCFLFRKPLDEIGDYKCDILVIKYVSSKVHTMAWSLLPSVSTWNKNNIFAKWFFVHISQCILLNPNDTGRCRKLLHIDIECTIQWENENTQGLIHRKGPRDFFYINHKPMVNVKKALCASLCISPWAFSHRITIAKRSLESLSVNQSLGLFTLPLD